MRNRFGDHALHLEHFVRYVMNCDRCGDPWGYSNADFFTSCFHHGPVDQRAKLASIVITTFAIEKCKDDPAVVLELKEIQHQICIAEKGEQLIELLDRASETAGYTV